MDYDVSQMVEKGAEYSSVVECLFMMQKVIGSIPLGSTEPFLVLVSAPQKLQYILFCPWDVAYKRSLAVNWISPRSGGSRFPFLLPEWSLNICLKSPYIKRVKRIINQ